MHQYSHFDDRALGRPPLFEGRSEGFTHAVLIGNLTGSVHTGLGIGQLDPDGWIAPHVHAFEESFYVLSGEAIVTLQGRSYRVGPGDYGTAKVGVPHAWHGIGGTPVRWLEMAAPQPKPYGAERDTFFPAGAGAPSVATGPIVAGTHDGVVLGHFDATQIPPPGERRTGAGTGLEGVFLKWLIDEQAGAAHHRLLYIEYQPEVGIGLHDHTFEEGYFILSGEVEATLDGQRYVATAGDVLWTGVGCVHAFRNISREPVRWLETFAPQPPRENVFRFMAEWDARARELEGAR
jgi:mannose-6-phosphate isomerase-like protein (cupin superfamily)